MRNQRACDADTLAHTVRQLAWVSRVVVAQADQFYCLIDGSITFDTANPPGHESNRPVLLHGQPWI